MCSPRMPKYIHDESRIIQSTNTSDIYGTYTNEALPIPQQNEPYVSRWGQIFYLGVALSSQKGRCWFLNFGSDPFCSLSFLFFSLPNHSVEDYDAMFNCMYVTCFARFFVDSQFYACKRQKQNYSGNKLLYFLNFFPLEFHFSSLPNL